MLEFLICVKKLKATWNCGQLSQVGSFVHAVNDVWL